MTAGRSQAPVILGRISGLYGVRGWVKVYSYTDPREAVLEHREWLIGHDDRWRKTRVVEGKRHGKAVLARLEGVDDRDQAAALVDSDIGIAREALPEPGEGKFYWCDLEGLRVVNRDGTELGTVAYLMETGAHDVLVTGGDAERLIPFVVGDVIRGVDLAGGVIEVDWEWE